MDEYIGLKALRPKFFDVVGQMDSDALHIDSIIDIIEDMPTVGWTSVDDALPEIDELVIVHCDDPFDIPPHFPRKKLLLIGYLDMENNWYDSDGPLENVTYWMPLPKPPEVEE